MSLELRNRIFDELQALVLIDPHTHINALNPASETLADILGYHYYTELAHSAGMPREAIEEPGIDAKEKVARLMNNLSPIQNTIQYSWFVEMAREFFDFDDDTVTSDNWEPLYDRAVEKMASPDWADQVLTQSKLEAVFLTNDFDDPLENFDTSVYIPCLRTDDLVFHLAKPEVQQRLQLATGQAVSGAASMRAALGVLFHHFKSKGARACAISLPPDFSPAKVADARADTAIAAVLRDGYNAGPAQLRAAANFVFWSLAEYCTEYHLPFDLMIGVNRAVYPAGVFQGQDLFDSRVSLIQYRDLFNAFPHVKFPISVLASVTNQELVSYSWIFPNVLANGHWWYSNTPTYIEQDLAARLEAIPQTKQVGYYSDMYKLEFALPKFNMFKRILAKVLAERFVIDRGWTEENAVALGHRVLRTNVEEIFFAPEPEPVPQPAVPSGMVEPHASAAGGMAAVGAAAFDETTGSEPAPADGFAFAAAADPAPAAPSFENVDTPAEPASADDFAFDAPAAEPAPAAPSFENVDAPAEPASADDFAFETPAVVPAPAAPSFETLAEAATAPAPTDDTMGIPPSFDLEESDAVPRFSDDTIAVPTRPLGTPLSADAAAIDDPAEAEGFGAVEAPDEPTNDGFGFLDDSASAIADDHDGSEFVLDELEAEPVKPAPQPAGGDIPVIAVDGPIGEADAGEHVLNLDFEPTADPPAPSDPIRIDTDAVGAPPDLGEFKIDTEDGATKSDEPPQFPGIVIDP